MAYPAMLKINDAYIIMSLFFTVFSERNILDANDIEKKTARK